MAITKETIFTAASGIAAAGGAATLAAVRKAVGGGSYTTISEALKEWRVSHQQATAPLREPAPQALSDRLAGVINETWTIALEMANERLNAERAALEQVRIDLEQSRREAVDLADQLSIELDQAQANIDLETSRGVAKALEIERLTGTLAHTSEGARTAQAALTEAHARAEQLTALLEREQAARAEAMERAAQAGQEAAVLASKLESAARETEEAKVQAKEALADARKAGEEAAELRGKLATTRKPAAK